MEISDSIIRELIRAAELILSRKDWLKELGDLSTAAKRRTFIAEHGGLPRDTDAQCDRLEIVRRYIGQRADVAPPKHSDDVSPAIRRTTRTDLPDLWKLACDKLTMAELGKCTPRLDSTTIPVGISTVGPDVAIYATTANSVPASPITPTTPKEITMSIIKVETRAFINNTPADSFTDAQLFTLIQQQEAKIKELDLIEHKPAALAKEIQERKDGIAALVAYMDTKA